MKSAVLLSIAHDLAHSLGSGLRCSLFGAPDPYAAAARLPEGVLTVDLLRCKVLSAPVPMSLEAMVESYLDDIELELQKRAIGQGAIRRLQVTYYPPSARTLYQKRFLVEAEDGQARVTEEWFEGLSGRRLPAAGRAAARPEAKAGRPVARPEGKGERAVATADNVRAGRSLTPAENASMTKLLKLNLHCPPAVMASLETCRWSEMGASVPPQAASRFNAWKAKQWTARRTAGTLHGLDDFLKRMDDEPKRLVSQSSFRAEGGEMVYVFRDDVGEVFSCFVIL